MTSGTFYPVFVAAAGSNQTASVRTASTAFSFDAATNILTVTATQSQYADLAENYIADGQYEPGTVVQLGESTEITICNEDSTSKVVGVVSTNPAMLMNTTLTGQYVVAVALTGRVPCAVAGPIKRGDLLVATSDGRARAEKNPQIGCLIGKALDNFDGDSGVIEIIVGVK